MPVSPLSPHATPPEQFYPLDDDERWELEEAIRLAVALDRKIAVARLEVDVKEAVVLDGGLYKASRVHVTLDGDLLNPADEEQLAILHAVGRAMNTETRTAEPLRQVN